MTEDINHTNASSYEIWKEVEVIKQRHLNGEEVDDNEWTRLRKEALIASNIEEQIRLELEEEEYLSD